MTPVKQTLLHDVVSVGNCFQACVASLLDMPLEEVPHFCNDFTSSIKWPQNYIEWLNRKGLFFIEFTMISNSTMEYWGYHIISGKSPRGIPHSIIGRNGDPYFDPHPSNAMLSGKREDWLYQFIIKRKN